MTTIRERNAAPHDDLKWTVEMRDRRDLLAALDRLVEAMEEVDDRMDSLYAALPSPQDDPVSWSQAVYFTRETAGRAIEEARKVTDE
jgi:hypothetical protein